MEGKRDVHLRLRALGNAERLRVLAFLRNAGEATVGDVAKALSIAPGSASYHIGCLVDGGLVERADHPDGDKRKSWWRAVDGENRLEGREADGLFHAANNAYGDAYGRYLASKDSLSDSWIEAEAGVDTVLALTVDEADVLKEELESLVRRWVEANKKTATAQGEGREQVALVVRAFRWIP
ncbi:MarR family transcriptional regulator [Atopobiaceae bacterium 24-176]